MWVNIVVIDMYKMLYNTILFPIREAPVNKNLANLHRAYEPCFIWSIPSQTYDNNWWRSPEQRFVMGLLKDNKIFKLGEDRPPVVTLNRSPDYKSIQVLSCAPYTGQYSTKTKALKLLQVRQSHRFVAWPLQSSELVYKDLAYFEVIESAWSYNIAMEFHGNWWQIVNLTWKRS